MWAGNLRVLGSRASSLLLVCATESCPDVLLGSLQPRTIKDESLVSDQARRSTLLEPYSCLAWMPQPNPSMHSSLT